jgi:hypothetical protein
MTESTINIESLIGRPVISKTGKSIGRVEEVRAEREGEDLVVTEFCVGAYALFERLSASILGTEILRFLRLRARHGGYRLRWDQLDLCGAKLQLLCDEGELMPMSDEREQ